MRARSEGAKVFFQIAGDVASASDLLETAGFKCLPHEIGDPDATIVLVDRVHGDVLRHPEVLERDIARWRSRGERIAFIDGAGVDSIRHRFPDFRVDLCIAPYVGESARDNDSIRLLVGAAFAALGPEYENPLPREIRPEADRILVSCGGSDPFGVTSLIMSALAEIQDRCFTVRVVLGPGLEPAYRASLIAMSHDSRHNMECFDSPDSLASHMRWSDLAVTTSGLTKYELAATGTPAVLISPDEMHARANDPFMTIGSAADVGPIESMKTVDIASTISTLLYDQRRRSDMACAGMRAVDGNGAARIVTALKELAYVKI